MRVQSTIRSSPSPYVYIVAMRFSTEDAPTTQGPIPVISPPWGNGFVAGNATHFVLWDPTNANPYTVNRFIDSTLINSIVTGIPVTSQPVGSGSNEIRFEVDLAQLFPTQAERDAIRSVQLNLLTMDRVPTSGTTKLWDALGDGRLPGEINFPITLSMRRNGAYSNTGSGTIEPTGDVADPQLDLSDWQVTISLQ